MEGNVFRGIFRTAVFLGLVLTAGCNAGDGEAFSSGVMNGAAMMRGAAPRQYYSPPPRPAANGTVYVPPARYVARPPSAGGNPSCPGATIGVDEYCRPLH